MTIAPASPAVPGITHHRAHVNGTTLHYAAAGTTGSPVLLVHGFPETWRAFRKLIPLLAASHRVFAVDLRGFGDSDTAAGDHDSKAAADDLHQLIAHAVQERQPGGNRTIVQDIHPINETAGEPGLGKADAGSVGDMEHCVSGRTLKLCA